MNRKSPPDDGRLSLLHARWILGETRSEEIGSVCYALLQDGYDSPTLRLIAGLVPAEHGDVPERLPLLFEELKMPEPTLVQAAWLVAQDIANEILQGAVAPNAGAGAIGGYGHRFPPLFPSLAIFIGLWSEWDDHPEHRERYDADIRSEASRLLSTKPPPEPGEGSDLDRLVSLADLKLLSGEAPPMRAAALRLAAGIPHGHFLAEDTVGPWMGIGSFHERLVLLVHTLLPFGLIRPEYRHFAQPVIEEFGLQVADMPSIDAAALSLTSESLTTLAGRQVQLPNPMEWLSAKDIVRITEASRGEPN